MISGKEFSRLALSLPATETCPHFERTGFRIIGKRMFATYLEKDNTANIFLTSQEQKAFCKLNKKNIYPVPNKWGERGATTFVLKNLPAEVLSECARDSLSTGVEGKKQIEILWL